VPQIYPQLRLPVYAVLAFSLSVVDVALILGPSNPPPLAVLAVRLFQDADLRFWFPAAAAATLQLAIAIAAIALWRGARSWPAPRAAPWVERGRRDAALATVAVAAGAATVALALLAALAIAGMALWSFATPVALSRRAAVGLHAVALVRLTAGLARPAATTLAVGAVATLVALALAIGLLEHEADVPRRERPPALSLLYLPLLVPQVAFPVRHAVLLVHAGWDGNVRRGGVGAPGLRVALPVPVARRPVAGVRSAHRAGGGEPRRVALADVPAGQAAAARAALLIAVAVGFAVSVGQYLATLFAGAGRVATLTTER